MDGQGQHNLNRNILPAAKCPADGIMDHAHLLHRQIHGMGDLLPLFVGPLPSHMHGDAALSVNVRQTGFGLKIRMFLQRRVILSLDNSAGGGPTSLHVAAANSPMNQFVGRPVGAVGRLVRVQPGRFRPERLFWVEHRRQVFPLDLDQITGGVSLLFRVCDYECNLIPFPPNHIGPRLGRSWSAKHGLVAQDKPIFVEWHITGCKDRCHPRSRLGGRDVNTHNAGVRPVGEQDFHMKHIVRNQIAWKGSLSGHLADSINALLALADRPVSSHSLIISQP